MSRANPSVGLSCIVTRNLLNPACYYLDMPGVAHRALLLPEILALLLSYLDPKSLARTARVSRLWNSAASDYLWHDLDRIARLFGVFDPLMARNWFDLASNHLAPLIFK